MARPRTRVRLARSLRAVVLGAAAVGTATTLFEWNLGRGLVLPLGLLALAPPIVYAILAFLVMPRTAVGGRLSWTLGACGINAAMGLATSTALSFGHSLEFDVAVTRAFAAFVPAPLIHMAAAPFILLAFGDVATPARTGSRGDRDAAPAAAAARPRPAAPNYDDVLRPPALATWAPVADTAIFERPRPPESEATDTALASPPAGVASAMVLEAPEVARAADEPMLRVALDRVAAQLPPDVFVFPPARLGECLREPHTLVVPQRLVAPQLGEGMVRIPWTLVEDQFPDLALAMPRAEIRRRYHDWVISLPLDEVVSQVPADLFRIVTPPVDLTEIAQFPAPFEQGPPAPDVEITEPRAPDVQLSERPAPDVEVTERPASSPVDDGSAPDEPLTALGRSLAVMLAPVGTLDWHARRVDGRPLVCFTAPGIERAAIDGLGTRGAMLLDRLASWPVEQVTAHGARVAYVLVPLPARGALVVAVRRGGPVAWLEVLTSRVRGGADRGATALSAPAAALTAREAPHRHPRLGEAARALAVLGGVTPAEVAAEDGAPAVYVFAADLDASLVSAGRAVHEALVAGHDEAALGRLEAVVLRRGRERVIVRPLESAERGAAVLVVAADVTLTGLAQRAAAQAAALLEAR